jgi:hypothetical protein
MDLGLVYDLFAGNSRRVFLTIIVISLLLLVVVRFFVLPYYSPEVRLSYAAASATITEELLVSVITTVFLAGLVVYLVPKAADPAELVLRGLQINTAFEATLPVCQFWWYKGGTGRYLRARTLPSLASRARVTSSTRELKIQLIDPNDTKVCRDYADYRRGLASAKDDAERWTEDRVREEVLATILGVFLARQNETLLALSLSVTRTFSTFRIDLSDRVVVVTKEDPKEPAFRFSPESSFYTAYKEEFLASMNQSRSISLENLGFGLEELGAIKSTFVRLKLADADLSEDSLNRIIGKCVDRKNPYA